MIIEKNNLKINIREGTLDEYVVKEVFGGTYKNFKLNPNDVVLNLGGNIGTFDLYFYDKVKEIVSFEPDKSNIEMYNKNIIDNSIKNCELMPYAVVGNTDKERTFYLNNKTNMGAHSFLIKRGRDKVVVPCMNINDALKLRKFNKIKMDIEGAEFEIFDAIESFSGIEAMTMELHFNIIGKEKVYEIIKLLKFHYRNVDNKEEYGGNWTCVLNCSDLIEENANIKFEMKKDEIKEISKQKQKSLFD